MKTTDRCCTTEIEKEIAFLRAVKTCVLGHVIKLSKEHKPNYIELSLMPDVSLLRDYLDTIGYVMVQDLPDLVVEHFCSANESLFIRLFLQPFSKSELYSVVKKDNIKLIQELLDIALDCALFDKEVECQN